ncbi:H/ACA ribonucleoprotein complex non-core subunit NAF1 [Galleria mellonella]|uniref:H/ACA ribonucleoprotein complex non-core subunit NAF1 n=1 Tax=Galleria mellonella TaxID=7137 RepID=A0A6J1WME7_GALME|nr:H/ACA ribonucleoprotein complex non-core subunit NAF1 [Galleria mellonella]
MENLDRSNNKNVSLSLIAGYGESDSDSDYTETRSNTGNEDSDTAELSEMVLKNNIINACAHGPLSRTILRDDEETTRHMIIDSSESGVVEYEVTEYRDSSDSDSSDSSNSDVESVKDIEEISSGDEDPVNRSGKLEPPRVLGELELDDLPPIEDLAISLPEQETTKIGTIASIVDRLVIVRSFPDTPAVDLDSILFLDNGAKTLGKVFDVFGPVTEPHYCVRFNSQEHVKERGIQTGLDVYIAPRSQHTSYVFLSELMKLKGSDASWRNDIEPPPNQIDYSDDEEERKANRARKEQNKLNKERGEENSENGEPSKNRKPPETRRNQRPSESSSRFGSGPSRGRNPFAAGSRRNNPNSFPRFARPWLANMDMRTPPHPNDPGGHPPFSAPPFSPNIPPMFPPFNPGTPPPLMGNAFQFGGNPRMHGPIPPMGISPFRHGVPVFGANFCNVAGPQPQWVNNGLPPPPGT